MNNPSEVSIVISFVAGILTFISPCILPLFPSYITYITGKSFEDVKTVDSSSNIRRLTALHSLFFILGFSIVFVAFGIAFSYLGSFFGIKRLWLERIGGLIIILFGLHIAGAFKVGFLNREKRLIYHRKNVGYFGSLFIGMAFAVGWTPCVGPILSSILIYASTLESMMRASVLLSFYSLGLGVPFFIAGLAVNQFLSLFNRFKGFMKYVPVVSGIFLVFFGLLLFFGRFSGLSAPHKVSEVTKKVEEKVEKKESFKKAPDFSLLDIHGNERSLSEFKGKVVILDFWATWCPPCGAMVPMFIELYNEYKVEGLEIIGVALDRNTGTIRAFSEKEGVNYTVLVGDREVSDLYGGIMSIPTTFVIDREGGIRKRYVGYRDRAVFESAIKELL